MNDLISIIIPAYNIESYLPATLDSILAQTYEPIEVIVVNDGSKDGTGAVADAYGAKDSRIRVIHKENGGVTSARLRGVAEARGAYIGFVDGDDSIEPQMYARLMENLQKYHADISHCGYQMVFPSRVDYYYNTGRIVQQDNIQGLWDLMEGAFVEPGVVSKLYRRELFAGLAEKMDLTIKINEDVLMNYWLFKASGKGVFEDICPYHYQIRAGSAANAKLNVHKLQDPIRVTKAILEDADPALEPVIIKRLAKQLISTATMGTCGQPELVKPYRKACRRELRQRLGDILRCSAVGKKLKLMALWAAIWPWSYGMVHKMYARISGIDRKYEIS